MTFSLKRSIFSGSQTLPRDGTKGLHQDDSHHLSDDATYNNNTMKRPGLPQSSFFQHLAWKKIT